jgi:predicted CXXCH cytochrome family protein
MTEVSDLKRFSLALVLVAALSLVFVGSAFANFGPHGGYATDTDSCAGCHRAHTSFSTIQFEPLDPGVLTPDQYPYALLVGSATTMSEFCNACHGNAAPGASTNVVSGLFDGGPSGASGQAIGASNGGVTVAYVTGSTFGAPLNGGGFAQSASLQDYDLQGAPAFKAITSAHSMEATGVLWGAGSSVSTKYLTCTSCHDPHGSSNYRLLKDTVNNNPVGGYAADGSPQGIVYSVETNYPYATNGWLKGNAGQAQMQAYVPNYTNGSQSIRSGTLGTSMSAWCSACHEEYDNQSSTYNYTPYEPVGGATQIGARARHRHPVDITLQQGDTILQIAAQASTIDTRVPLEVNPGAGTARQNQLGCLTCHYAHGGSSVMTGWAAAHYELNGSGTWAPVRDTTPGVDPVKSGDPGLLGGAAITGTSALLRADNRGVCERCHNK